MRNLKLIILLGLFVFLLGACAEKEITPKVPTVKPPEQSGERVEKGFTHIQMEKGKVVLRVKGDSASGLDKGKVTIKNPKVERFFYKGDEKNSIKVEGRTGIWNRKGGRVQVKEEVKGIVQFKEKIVIEHADKMAYEPSTHLLVLRGNVRIKQARSVLNAGEVKIYLDEKDGRIIKIMAEGKVSGIIFPEELKKNR